MECNWPLNNLALAAYSRKKSTTLIFLSLGFWTSLIWSLWHVLCYMGIYSKFIIDKRQKERNVIRAKNTKLIENTKLINDRWKMIFLVFISVGVTVLAEEHCNVGRLSTKSSCKKSQRRKMNAWKRKRLFRRPIWNIWPRLPNTEILLQTTWKWN